MEDDQLVNYLKSLNDAQTNEQILDILNKPKQTFPFNSNLIPTFSNPQLRENTDRILIQNKQFESDESRRIKDNILKNLQDIVTLWSIKIAKEEKQIYEEQLQHCAAVLIPYGSFLLGVSGQESDLDLICVVPGFIDRKIHFFKGLYETLEAQPNVYKINKIETSQNPIIKLYYKYTNNQTSVEAQIDINFAQLNRDTIPKKIDDELDELRKTILNTEKPSIDALNGRKNGIMIRHSVQNEKQFVDSLRIIKLWSKKRGISSNIIGYLGGISWAILVAKICQMFPHLNSFQTVFMFFKIYTMWNWQRDSVVIDSEDYMNSFVDSSWPQTKKPQELMMIITPAMPYINSAYKVNLITYKAIGKEMLRALEILESNSIEETVKWETLFQNLDIFSEYRYFVTVSIVSNNIHDFHKWSGFCEAQIVSLLEIIGDYLFHGNLKRQQNQDSEEYKVFDDQFNTLEDSYELRVSSSGLENQETDFKCSLNYYIGIKKQDPKAWPLFLISPIARFSEKILKNKQKLKFDIDDNMKLYFQHRPDIKKKDSPEQNFQESKKRKPSQLNEMEYITEEPKKRIKQQDSIFNSAELVRRVSNDQQTYDNADLSKTLEELF